MIKELRFIQEDLENDMIGFLTAAIILSLLFAGLIAIYLSLDSSNLGLTYSWAALTAGSAIALVASNTRRYRIATWVYLISFIAFLGLDINFSGLDSRAFFLLPLPIILSALLLEEKWMPYVGILTVLAAIAPTYSHGSWLGIWNYIFIPAVVIGVSGFTLWLYAQSKLGYVYWAVDSQRKNEERAKVFYEQREQLKEAMLAVQKANAKLENLNLELAKARKQAEDASEAKSTFLSNMSHELRTPLNTVIGYSSSMLNMPAMYKHEPLGDIYKKDLQVILSNGQYLLGLINDILDLSKIEAGKLHIHPENMKLDDILQGVMTTSIGLTQDKPIQIRPDYDETLPTVRADDVRVRQVLLNLMSNAIKFTESGSVTLSAKVVDEGVKLAVTDTGIGIPEDALQRIFDRFEQAQYDTDRHYGGTGLGLDISQRLCQMHGTTLSVESQVGQGSTFSFILPIVEAADEANELEEDDTMATVETADVNQMLEMSIVLVIENDAQTRKLLRRTLEPNAYIVLEAANGAHGIESVEGALPELVILDLKLPDIDGQEVLAQMRANPVTADIPVIVLSALNQTDENSKLADMYFKKPVRPLILLEAMKKLLESRETPELTHENITP